MLNSFRRITSSGKYLPEIDGLRFIAITSVIIYHLNSVIFIKNHFVYSDSKSDYKLLLYFLKNGDRGVPIFFAISGFILAVPFARWHLKGDKKVALKSYFLRRLTRLEPPYIIAMIGLFIANAFIVKRFTIPQLLPSFISSVFYLNNFFNYRGAWPFINYVAWSLEIEVQFYILSPFLANIFKLPLHLRRVIMLSVIVMWPLLHNFLMFPFRSIYDYLQFFAIGFLLADFFVNKENYRLSKKKSAAVGCLLFLAIWSIPGEFTFSYAIQSPIQLGFPLLILAFFYLVLFTEIWKKIMSTKVISIIGGMCYSFYLLHFAIISIISKITLQYRFSNFYIADLIVNFILILSAILVTCSLFFFFIERPFMKKEWPQQIWMKLKGIKHDLYGNREY